MWKCSYCGKENNDQSPNCGGCGSTLNADPSQAAAQPSAPESDRQVKGRKLMRNGVFWCIGGVILTLAGYMIASSNPVSGHYWIFYGAIIVGIAQFLRGSAMTSGRDTNLAAEDHLNEAARLESVDRDKALALYAEIVKSYPGTRASEEAGRNIRTLQHQQN